MTQVKECSFNPDAVARAIHQFVTLDLASPCQIAELSDKLLARDVFSFFQTTQFLKKYKFKNSLIDTRQAAKDVFLSNLERMRSVNDNLHLLFKDDLKLIPAQTRLSLLRARAICHQILTPFTTEELFDECKHSNGTTLGLKFVETNLEDKMYYPLSSSDTCVKLFELYKQYDPQLANYIDEYNMYNTQPTYSVKNSSKTTFVDKTNKIDRTIAIEPTLNMFFQKGAESLLRDRLLPYLDLTNLQDTHKQLALYGSLTADISTVDFSSASDSISVELVKFLLPPAWFMLLSSIRCSSTVLDDVIYTDLPMISTMGNATTFPLETLVFYSLAYACSAPFTGKSLFAECKDLKISVYGDDCILPRHATSSFIELAQYVGMLVNVEKTFTGDVKFRESCGADCFDFRNVRPFHLKSPSNLSLLGQEAWFYTIMNGLLKKYISYFGELSYVYRLSFLPYIDKFFIENNLMVKVVPDDFPDDAGLKVYGDYHRIKRLFKAPFSRILVDKHGSAVFQALEFKYLGRKDH